jgi:hypothetical protein
LLVRRVEPRLLLVGQRAVEALELRANDGDCLRHTLDPLLHHFKPSGRGEHNIDRTGIFDCLRSSDHRIGKFIEPGALLGSWGDALLDAINRPTGDLSGGVAAHLAELARKVGLAVLCPLIYRRGRRALRLLARQIAGEIAAAKRPEESGINVTVAVIPERATEAIAPEDIVEDIVIGMGPEHRAIPPVSIAESRTGIVGGKAIVGKMACVRNRGLYPLSPCQPAEVMVP